MKNIVGLCLTASTLAACSEKIVQIPQPDPGVVAVPFTGFSNVPTNSAVAFTGNGVGATYTRNSKTGVLTLGTPQGPTPATAILTTTNGVRTAVAVLGVNSGASYNTLTGGSEVSGNGLIVGRNNTQSDVVVAGDPDALAHEHQTFGAWVSGLGDNAGTMGAASFGNATAAANMPSGTTASYDGRSTGVVQDFSGQALLTDSTVSVSTDFTTASISSTDTRTSDPATLAATAAPHLDFTGSGAVAGSEFSASIASAGSLVSPSLITGTANGTFYGSAAEEVGGTFQASGNGVTYMGAFGAKQ